MKKTLAIISAFLVLGCASDDSSNDVSMLPGLNYYKFTSAHNARLLNTTLNKGKIISFSNQSGQMIRYKVAARFKGRSADVSGDFSGGGITNFYYDEQRVSLESLDFVESQNSGMSFTIFKNSASGLKARFFLDRWNGQSEDFVISNIDGLLQAFSANGKTYPKVIVINSNSDDSVVVDGFPKNAITVYYDLNYGIVGFDDLDGNEWRRN
ncbi:MAG: hypothetical protein EOO50_13220 [Flavobacterium sp.]|uniref:hypothetical protein n=1 Tax=Flavobacterium sp. TaxID=239 RepID=UPI0012078E73|nr:hypothetical protein [Flavobacterium sp.]RZJ65606.1 MAG: hypothetical protein EOO50_13220 [Flavobacterium sp.]